MYLTIFIGAAVFIIGELISNYTLFKYIKGYFSINDISKNNTSNEDTNKQQKFLFMEISTFKGVLERFVLFLALHCGFTPILVVFGALKIGTRLDNKTLISNDYFLVGNFASILIAILYTIIHNKLTTLW
jgi:hypothetical protein